MYESADLGFSASECYISPGPLRLLRADNSPTFYSKAVFRLLVTAADVLHSWTVPA